MPDVVVHDDGGREVRLAEVVGRRPVVLQLGSRSCPVFRYRRFGMHELQREFAGRVDFLVLYTQEAHPVGSPSPYTDEEWDMWINRLTGVRLGATMTPDERVALRQVWVDPAELRPVLRRLLAAASEAPESTQRRR